MRAASRRVALATPGRRRRRRRRRSRAHRSEFLYFAFATGSSCSGSASSASLLLLAIFGPMLTEHPPLEFSGPTDSPPSHEYWFGTTSFGQDVFAQFVHGLRAAFLVGAVGGGIAWLLGAVRRLHRRLPQRLDRRRADHAHERRARDPDARDPDHRRGLPERAQLRDRGDPDRPHVVAVGRARGSRADLLAEDARLRRHRAAERPKLASDHRHARSRRT